MRALAIAVLVSASLARPAYAGDAELGHQLAERWCTSCHAVDPGQVGQTNVPSFAAIAAQHGGDGRWVRAWLMTPHPSMPDMSLTRIEIDNVVAYLGSLVPAKKAE